jgi:hypothetical protein
VRLSTPRKATNLKKRYLRKAITEYEYSFAREYEKRRLTRRAVTQGTVDFDWQDAEVELCPDGAWVAARVWVPKEWLRVKQKRST